MKQGTCMQTFIKMFMVVFNKVTQVICSPMFLLVVNITLFLGAATVMSLGIVVLVDPVRAININNGIPGLSKYWQYLFELDQVSNTIGIVLTTIGSYSLVVGFFGLVVAFSKRKSLHITYAVLNSLALLAGLGVIIGLAVDVNSPKREYQESMFYARVNHFKPVEIRGDRVILSTDLRARAWQTLQFEHNCCGAYSYYDYANDPYWKYGTQYNESVNVPPSCCAQIVKGYVPDKTDNFIDLDKCMYGYPYYSGYFNTQNCFDVLMSDNQFTANGVITLSSLLLLHVIVMLTTMFSLARTNPSYNSVETSQ